MSIIYILISFILVQSNGLVIKIQDRFETVNSIEADFIQI